MEIKQDFSVIVQRVFAPSSLNEEYRVWVRLETGFVGEFKLVLGLWLQGETSERAITAANNLVPMFVWVRRDFAMRLQVITYHLTGFGLPRAEWTKHLLFFVNGEPFMQEDYLGELPGMQPKASKGP